MTHLLMIKEKYSKIAKLCVAFPFVYHIRYESGFFLIPSVTVIDIL